MFITRKTKNLSKKAYQGDSKTLLAFNMDKTKLANFAGYTIECKPGNNSSYYLYNKLTFANPADRVHFRKINQGKTDKPKAKKLLNLYTNNKLAISYYNPIDLHFTDRALFGGCW